MNTAELVEVLEDTKERWLGWTTNPTVPMVNIQVLAECILDALDHRSDDEAEVRFKIAENSTPAGAPALSIWDIITGRTHSVLLPVPKSGEMRWSSVVLRGNVIEVLAWDHGEAMEAADELLAQVRVGATDIGVYELHVLGTGPRATGA